MNYKIRPQVSMRLLFALVAIALLVVPSMFAQVERTSSLQGTVKDPSGAVVSGATVELTSPALFTGKATYTTDSSGYYRFGDLRPGIYTMTVTKSGFSTYKQADIDLAVGRLPTIDVSLKVGATTEVVEVTGAAPQIDVVASKVQTNVTQDMLLDIPKGRSFQSVIQFAPGARAEPLQGGPNNGVLGYQIDGATNAENSYMVEGQETASIQYGDSRTNVPMEFTQEVVIKSSGFEAEHGGAIGGIVNVIQKRGSNSWHGSIFTYYSGDTLDAAPNRVERSPGCGAQTFAATGSTNSRICATEYIQPIKDHYRIWEPGFEVGGYLLKDKLWVFGSSVPRLFRQERTVLMDDLVPLTPAFDTGPRKYNSSTDTYYSLGRVDAMPWQKVHIYGTWQYNYSKNQGYSQPSADDVYMRRTIDPITGLFTLCVNNAVNGCNVGGAGNSPDDFNRGIGYRAPEMILGLGGDVTITPNLVLSSRWGRFYNDYQDRGLPTGIRYRYIDTTYNYATTIPASASTAALDGTTLGAGHSSIHPGGYSTIGANTNTFFNQYWRTSYSVDLSYFHKGWGTHNWKFGYLFNQVSNNVDTHYNTADAYVAFDTAWSPSFISCPASIAAFNVATFPDLRALPTDPDPRTDCRGNWGTINFRELATTGTAKSYTHGLYIQDAWNVGHGLTLNLGVRFDKENLPSYAPGLPSIKFGWGEKIAPRLGASWDVMQNGKLKIYGSFGYFYDIMKYDLPRGSFGGDYWHDCGFAMDSPNFLTDFVPVRDPANGNHYCTAAGPSALSIVANPLGRPGGTFIGSEDFRIPSNDPSLACDAAGTIGSCVTALEELKPTKQHEIVLGVDWAITPRLALATRWARKRLDRTIEDAGVLSPTGEGYSIVNPGFGQHASTCAGCPANPRANRRYDGLEFRLTKAASAKWYGEVSYTYSRLRGNFSGSTATDISDGGAGRQGANVSRAFDEPFMSFDAHGNAIDGPLATDRPHALKGAGYYRLKWWKMETVIGGFQQWYSGSPLSSYMSVWGAPVFVEGRGNWVDFTVDSTGHFIPGTIEKGKRTATFSQTDLSIIQEMHVSKQNERLKLGLEMNFTNIFNQHSPTFIRSDILRTSSILPEVINPLGAVCDPAGDGSLPPVIPGGENCFSPYYPQLMNAAYDYFGQANETDNGGTSWSGRQSRRTPNPSYGLPYGWQNPRGIRFKIKFTF